MLYLEHVRIWKCLFLLPFLFHILGYLCLLVHPAKITLGVFSNNPALLPNNHTLFHNNPALFHNNHTLLPNNPALFHNNPALFHNNHTLLPNNPALFKKWKRYGIKKILFHKLIALKHRWFY